MVDKIYVGRRKTSVARVILRNGNGKITVNGREFEKAFPMLDSREDIEGPLVVTETKGKYDLHVNVRGGGTTGQAGATMLGLARALKKYDEGLVKTLRDGGYLTRDGRMVERKKPGQKGARKRFQFSKR